MADAEIYARIPLLYLPKNWSEVVLKAGEEVNEVCRLFPSDFKIEDGLVLRVRVGNGCVDDILEQVHTIARELGVEPIIRWHYL